MFSSFATGCSKDHRQVVKNQNNPKIIIEEYFNHWNNKDSNKMILLHTEARQKDYRNSNMQWEFDNLMSVKLLSCEEVTSKSLIEDEIKRAVDAKVVPKDANNENVKCFNVKFDIKLNNPNEGSRDDGVSQERITLVRNDKNSQWLIQDMGEA
ncbi:putative lipoprotein (plasmid) [Clostridium botulinum BKT015925]|nr:DUF4829 domain-containing protein [Clostridium botulinum]AEB77606.1 putative lipoprotein [Clostridium botulinum BKT015925]KEH95999.1 putative lipoprotein [Clostridium botulinum C/D str. Sp77]